MYVCMLTTFRFVLWYFALMLQKFFPMWYTELLPIRQHYNFGRERLIWFLAGCTALYCQIRKAARMNHRNVTYTTCCSIHLLRIFWIIWNTNKMTAPVTQYNQYINKFANLFAIIYTHTHTQTDSRIHILSEFLPNPVAETIKMLTNNIFKFT